MGLDDGWKEKAACRNVADPDIFYPHTQRGVRVDAGLAKRVCNTCEVQSHCLAYALFHRERFGVWGGMTDRERARLPRGVKERIRKSWRRQFPTAEPKKNTLGRAPRRRGVRSGIS